MLQKGGGIMKDIVKFQLGEKKYVCISVTSNCGRPFDITDAKYILKKGDEGEASGKCDIKNNSDTETILSALIQPMAKSTYKLEYTYDIPPEKLMKTVRVQVE